MVNGVKSGRQVQKIDLQKMSVSLRMYAILEKPSNLLNKTNFEQKQGMPKIGCMGGLAPRRQAHLTLPRILCKPWNPHRRPLANLELVLLGCCKIYLFRPTSGI